MMLADLRYSKAEAREEAKESAAAEPGYEKAGSAPWGMCLHLEKRELDKLGISALPGVGDEWHITAVARVTQVSQSSGADRDDSMSVALSIEMMGVDMRESAAEEAAEGAQTPAKEAGEAKRARSVLGSY
jgi:hypothetical protein